MKTHKRSLSVQTDSDDDLDGASSAVSKPTHEEISALAHRFYQQEGCPDGLADDHWFAAEDRLQG